MGAAMRYGYWACAVAETGVSLGDQVGKDLVGEPVADKGAHHAKRGLFVAEAMQGADVTRAHLRYGFGHIEAAVTREAREHRLFEGQRGRLSAGGDVTHVRPPCLFSAA